MKTDANSRTIRYTDIPLPQTVVHYCAQYDIQYVVISAGSRNAPLTNGFVEDPFFTTYSVVDERAAAFFALGIAQQLNTPVALVCTSGSALLNYYPAVAEAYYSEIPLVILSADRMPHRVDIGDGQTIQQEGVFGPHLIGTAALKPDVSHATDALLASNKQAYFSQHPTTEEIDALQHKHQTHNIEELQRIFALATTAKGPVHANIPMEEPLYGMTNTPLAFPPTPAIQPAAFDTTFEDFVLAWKNASRKMILMGVSKPSARLTAMLNDLLQDPSVTILTEKTSNYSHPNAVTAIDCLMAPMELEQNGGEAELKPDLLITVGGMIVSKKIKFFLRKHQASQHLHVDETKANDTFYHLSKHIYAPAVNAFSAISDLAHRAESNYQATVLKRYKNYLKKGAVYLNRIPFSDLRVFDLITKALPKNTHLQVANSSAIRYLQLFDLPNTTEVYCNRGTAGIDGSTATAMGAAQVNAKQLVFITGDLSFFYDINGLWHNYIPSHARIIIINNQGGGIFRILPGEKDSPKYETYFETIHRRKARDIAKGFGFSYKRVHTNWGLKNTLRHFFKPSKQPKILEICTPRKVNDTVLLDYFRAMANTTH
jgi:2-succinyl-5-enolpyruvyl-6-hydroxy-3-cyclohexene-1-carboxylate synthase